MYPETKEVYKDNPKFYETIGATNHPDVEEWQLVEERRERQYRKELMELD